jgi:general stress protein 26
MNPDVLEYVKGERVCVLALEMMDGSPHAATVHFANTDGPIFVFETNRTYRKSEPLFGKKTTRASLVIGSTESTKKTLQLDGEAKLLGDDSVQLRETYLKKFPDKTGKLDGPDVVLFSFTPTWWRFTDWTKPKGSQILTSTD